MKTLYLLLSFLWVVAIASDAPTKTSEGEDGVCEQGQNCDEEDVLSALQHRKTQRPEPAVASTESEHEPKERKFWFGHRRRRHDGEDDDSGDSDGGSYDGDNDGDGFSTNCMLRCDLCDQTPQECVCPTNCGNCGDRKTRCGNDGLDVSGDCTPFFFRPWESAADTCDPTGEWFAEGKIVPTSYYQVWDTTSSDKWVTHACDGAGIQTDCLGDYGYFEHFDSFRLNPDVQCSVGVQDTDHQPCGFNHPAGVSFDVYDCGWWRAYDDPYKASALDQTGCPGGPPGNAPIPDNCFTPGQAVIDGGLLGPAGNEWFNTVVYALANCQGCPEGGALLNTFRNAGGYSAFFMGTVSPWVCNTKPDGDGAYTYPYTLQKQGDKYIDCYCDNEPYTGRQNFPPEPNWGTGIVYCGLNGDDDTMDCDFIEIVKGNWDPSGCVTNECGGFSRKVSTFTIARDNWGAWA